MFPRASASLVIVVLALSGSLWAADPDQEKGAEAADKEKGEERVVPKEPEEKKEGENKLLGTQGSWHGRLGPGKNGAVMTLLTMPAEKGGENFKPETLYLFAMPELGPKLLEYKKSGVKVLITGLLAPDLKSVKVESVSEAADQKKKKK